MTEQKLITEQLVAAALHNAALAAWCATWSNPFEPSALELSRALAWFVSQNEALQAELVRAKQLAPVNMTMICHSPECSAHRELARKRRIIPQQEGG